MSIENTQKKWANAMGIMALLGFGMAILPWVAEIDMMDGGGALFMVGLMLGLTGLITFFMFRNRAKQMDDILNNRKIIARWKVEGMAWDNFAEKDVAALKKNAWATWLLIAFFFVLFTGIFWFMTEDEDDANFFLLLMGGIFAFISLAAWLATQSRASARQKQRSGEVIIADNCLTLNSEFHIWTGFGTRLESVNYYEMDKILEFTYSYIVRGGRQFQELRVPVPEKEEGQLQKVLQHFGISPLAYSPSETTEEEEEEDYPESSSFVKEEKKEDNNEGFEVKF